MSLWESRERTRSRTRPLDVHSRERTPRRVGPRRAGVQRLLVACHHVGTKFCLADILTKATDGDTFARMRSVIRNTAEDDAGHSVRRMLTTLMRVSPRRRA